MHSTLAVGSEPHSVGWVRSAFCKLGPNHSVSWVRLVRSAFRW